MIDLPHSFAESEDWPPELQSLDALERVIAVLRALPLPIQVKRKKLYFWGKSLGVLLPKETYARLEPGGLS
jgi:hypothetical protein